MGSCKCTFDGNVVLLVTFARSFSQVDGFIAKYFNSMSVLGSYLDPIADKVLITLVTLSLWSTGDLPGESELRKTFEFHRTLRLTTICPQAVLFLYLYFETLPWSWAVLYFVRKS